MSYPSRTSSSTTATGSPLQASWVIEVMFARYTIHVLCLYVHEESIEIDPIPDMSHRSIYSG